MLKVRFLPANRAKFCTQRKPSRNPNGIQRNRRGSPNSKPKGNPKGIQRESQRTSKFDTQRDPKGNRRCNRHTSLFDIKWSSEGVARVFQGPFPEHEIPGLKVQRLGTYMPLEPHRSEACRSCQPMHVLSFGEGRFIALSFFYLQV